MKRTSLIRKVVVMLVVQIILVTTVFGFFCFTTYANSRREEINLTDQVLQVYCAQVNGALLRAESALQNVVLNRLDELDLLQSEQESARYYAGNEIFNTLRSVMQGDSGIDLIAVYDKNFGNSYYVQSEGRLTLDQRSALENYTKDLSEQGYRSNIWKSVILGDNAYLYRYYTQNGHIVAAYIKAETLLALNGGDRDDQITWVLSDSGNGILAQSGSAAIHAVVGSPREELDAGRSIIRDGDVSDGLFILTAVVSQNGITRQIRFSMIVMGLLILTLVVFSLLLLRYEHHSIILPLQSMTGQLEKMNREDSDLRLQQDCDSMEFDILQGSFNRLMDENVTLRLRTYEKQIETQDAELRSIRLQLRPHFFLNAMTTISSLSIQGKNEQIKDYINALSRNIRYMFKSGMHTVPLSEELTNVGYYFEMQELKYPDTVFYMLQQDPGTEDWPVPQMIIHTVLENEYKHAVSVDRTLTILAGISTVEYDGETMLCIEIEDDGQGYPDEVLDSGNRRMGTDGSRVGLSSIDRMLEIMYSRAGLMQLSNVEPHGAKTRILIPAVPVNEYRESQPKNV